MANLELHINDIVEVTLTAAGAERFNDRYSDFPASFRPVKRREGDVLKDSLWHVIQVFGPMLALGMPAPFKDGKLTILNKQGT